MTRISLDNNKWPFFSLLFLNLYGSGSVKEVKGIRALVPSIIIFFFFSFNPVFERNNTIGKAILGMNSNLLKFFFAYIDRKKHFSNYLFFKSLFKSCMLPIIKMFDLFVARKKGLTVRHEVAEITLQRAAH